MSRSYRKPYHGIVCYTSKSVQDYKRIRAQRERARVRDAILSGDYDLAQVELAPWDDYNAPTDGKKHYMPDDERLWRK